MTTFLEISTWAWIAGVFIVIKCIFKYLAWLYHDKDKTLRDAVRLTWDYLSQHTYFEVARAALQRLYDRLAGIFQKRIRFLYLFLFFLLLNAASLFLGKWHFSYNSLFVPVLCIFVIGMRRRRTPSAGCRLHARRYPALRRCNCH